MQMHNTTTYHRFFCWKIPFQRWSADHPRGLSRWCPCRQTASSRGHRFAVTYTFSYTSKRHNKSSPNRHRAPGPASCSSAILLQGGPWIASQASRYYRGEARVFVTELGKLIALEGTPRGLVVQHVFVWH